MKQNPRIVLIANFHNDTDKGILNALDDDDRKKAFVVAHLYELSSMSPHFVSRITKANPYVYISQGKVSSEPIKDWQVLFMADTLSIAEYPDEIFDPQTLVMYHTTPGDLASFLATKLIKGKKQGMHEPGEENGYALIGYLIDAYDEPSHSFNGAAYDAAIEMLTEWFDIDEVLEAKLDLLHNCLLPKTIPQHLEKRLSAYQASFEVFNASRTEQWNDPKYIDALVALRRSLLGS